MATAKVANTFLVGADPELVLLDPPNLVCCRVGPTGKFYGFDHSGWVLEPHPTPDVSVRQVCSNIKKSLDVMLAQYERYRFRAGAYITSPQRNVTLGGHVHLDLPRLNISQMMAMDSLTNSFEDLDILPKAECASRRRHGYGAAGDVRAEHGHVEYRSMCSWLFSRKTSMLCMTGIKLAAVAPETVPIKGFHSIKALSKWLETFKDADDDARWIIDRGYFDVSMEAKPDASVTDVWHSCPKRGAALIAQLVTEEAQLEINRVQQQADLAAQARTRRNERDRARRAMQQQHNMMTDLMQGAVLNNL